MAFTLTSSDFAPGAEIPAVHTCQGDDHSPALVWSGVPAGARSLALIVDDPDAPDPRAPRTVWAHWLLYNLPPADGTLPRAVARPALPPGTREGKNDFGRTGYGGPCPPIGRHRYFHRLFALDLVLPDLGTPSRPALLQAMRGHVLETAELMGTYQKHA
ncbi:MAG TPA: YbhB/YbcL family Raf kinase inhibitor-like protein [Polyangia bacterium]|nr:YbhB/YbcL family Raf kinase inhibitor-like protein [Polyangia bacterium]